jgi:hypothetical protein
LPDVINPDEYVCYTIRVPKNRFYIAAFLGALYNLTSARFWQDDPLHLALPVARVWQAVYDDLVKGSCEPGTENIGGELEDTGMRLRIDPDNGCIIQQWNDCDQSWCTFIDVAKCVQQNGGNQENQGGQPLPGQAQTYCLTIPAAGSYLYPAQVNSGDIISADTFGGMWTDGKLGIISTWFCANGQENVAGICGGGTTTDGTDPLPGNYHMQLIAAIKDDGGTLVYYPLGQAGSFVVPGGVTNKPMYLTCNDVSTDTGRAGAINACVKIQVSNPGIAVTQSNGTGPSSVGYGPIYTFTSDVAGGGGRPYMNWRLSAAARLTIISATGFVPALGVGDWYDYEYPTGVNHSSGNPTSTTQPTDWTPNTPIVEIQMVGAAGHQFSIGVQFSPI